MRVLAMGFVAVGVQTVRCRSQLAIEIKKTVDFTMPPLLYLCNSLHVPIICKIYIDPYVASV
jgi:hypothetical protein